jgi:hypothetical protein
MGHHLARRLFLLVVLLGIAGSALAQNQKNPAPTSWWVDVRQHGAKGEAPQMTRTPSAGRSTQHRPGASCTFRPACTGSPTRS